MATFVMQAMGCEVAAINTVNFSNHTGYRQFQGRRTPASEIHDLYTGLQQSYLTTDFHVLLSGYAPSADVVQAVGLIARDLRTRSTVHPGDFFWILDPVMGDQGRLYVSEDIVPAYRDLVREADLILPNQFEAELLSGVKIESLADVGRAIGEFHRGFGVRHVIVTSVRVDAGNEEEEEDSQKGKKGKKWMSVVGSTRKEDGEARLFKVDVPVIDCFFSGTGDMFAALMVARLRRECACDGLLDGRSWMSGDEVTAEKLPLARATAKVLSSMHVVLEKTVKARDEEMKKFGRSPGASIGGLEGQGHEGNDSEEKRRYLAETKAAEVKIVRNWRDLLEPEERFKAEALELP